METGNYWVERARLLRSELLLEEEVKELENVDFDNLVCFWSI